MSLQCFYMFGEGTLFTLHGSHRALDDAIDCCIAPEMLHGKRLVGRMGVKLI